jgi:hypothetical protein
MTTEEERFLLDRERFEFDRLSASHERELRERDFKEQRRARIWSQIATFLPIVAIILGFYVNLSLESRKQFNADNALAKNIKREFIDRQLSELYYPIQLRLEKDTAVWTLSKNLAGRAQLATTADFSSFIEYQILLPNHEEIVKILDTKFSLLKNGDENFDPKGLQSSIAHYERHVAAYRALRTLKVQANPIDVCSDCDFPSDFRKLISERISALEEQRSDLLRQLLGN